MSFPPLAGGDHAILSQEFCSGYVDISGVWNTGFYCPQTGSTLAVYCCGTPNYKYCCTTKPENGTGAGIVEDYSFHTSVGAGTGGTTLGRPTGITENGAGDLVTIDSVGNDYSGATRMRPASDEDLNKFDSDLTSLNLSDVPIIFGVACGVAAVLILVILVGFYLTSCCAHYHQLAQNRKRRSSMPGIYRGVATTNTSTNSGLVNLYSPTHSAGGATPGSLPGSLVGGAGILAATENTQTYIVHHHHHSNPPASPDSISTTDHYPMGMAGGSTSIVTTPLDIEWSSTAQYHQKPQQATYSSASQLQQQQQPQSLNLLSNHIITDNRIHYTVHQTQNRLAVALTGSMNRLSDRASPCPNPASSSYPVNIPLTPPDGYSYPRQITRGVSPPPQYSSSMLARAESPPYYPSFDNPSSAGSSFDHESSLHNQPYNHNYLSRTSTLPLSMARKPPSGANRPLLTSPVPYGSNLPTPQQQQQQQPKSILRTSQNYRRVVTNETPPPIPPHNSNSTVFFGGTGATYAAGSGSVEGATGGSVGIMGSSGNITYRNVDSRTNLSSQPLLLLESKVENKGAVLRDDGPPERADEDDEEETGLHTATVIRRSSVSKAVNASAVEEDEEEEEEERRDRFDIHDIDSDALSRLIELDLDSKL